MNAAAATPGRHLRRVCEFFLLLTSLLSLITCPHSKVEESFNLQASHDLFYHGLGPAWKSSWLQDNYVGVVDVRVDDDAVRDSCESTTGGRLQAEACSLRIDASDLPYDHVKFPGGGFQCAEISSTLNHSGRL
jgi:hypothetical protein